MTFDECLDWLKKHNELEAYKSGGPNPLFDMLEEIGMKIAQKVKKDIVKYQKAILKRQQAATIRFNY